MRELGRLIRDERERAGLRAYELARAINKQPSYVTRLETGGMKTLPPPEELERLGRVLGIPVPEMVRAAGYRLEAPEEDEDAQLAALHARVDGALRLLVGRPAVADRVLNSLAHTVRMFDGVNPPPAPSRADPDEPGSREAPDEDPDAPQDR